MSGAVTVIVPVWNRRDLLERLLCRLRAQTHPIAEVLVVDDGSQDGSADLAAAMGARTIRCDRHAGFAQAVNRGILACGTPLAALVNNDVELAADWLEKLSAALAPDVWFVTGRILQAAEPSRIDATFDAICRGGTSWRVGHNLLDGPLFREPCQIWSAPLTAALFRVELFHTVGLLDERFESYLEDVDLGLRCALAGCAGQYVPDAVAWHQGSATLGRWHPESTRLIARNQVTLIAKHYSGRLLLRYAWHILVAQGLWGILALRHGRGWPWLRGKVEGLRRFREIRHITGAQLDGRAPSARLDLRSIVRQSESNIYLARGADFYWTLYFLLTASGAK